MKLGISIKIDVTKIEKARLHKGEKGTYLDMTTFIDTENPSQYGDHGFISQDVSKEEREQGVKTPILGNSKVFFFGDSEGEQAQGSVRQETPQPPPPPMPQDEGMDDIPF